VRYIHTEQLSNLPSQKKNKPKPPNQPNFYNLQIKSDNKELNFFTSTIFNRRLLIYELSGNYTDRTTILLPFSPFPLKN